MNLKTLKTQNFRNLEGESLDFNDGINVLCGSNASGKTNTLEAVYLFAAGKSFRTSNDKDFIKHGEDFAKAEISFVSGSAITKNMSVSFMKSGRSAVKVMCNEGVRVDKASEFLGNFRAVLFTPDHLELVKGAPEERRKLCDLALCQIKPRYVRALNDYNKVLVSRNNYLKKIKTTSLKLDNDYLDVLNRQLSVAGAVIMKQRGLFCMKLRDYAAQAYGKITGGVERLNAEYSSRAKVADISDEKQCEEAIYKLLLESMTSDLGSGRTINGPHRDDMLIYISDKSEGAVFEGLTSDFDEDDNKASEYAARTFASQGQQRSAVLALKMAEGEMIKELCGEYPVFLLDDLFGELDKERRLKLCNMLDERQCIITACDFSSIPSMDNVHVTQVASGRYSAMDKCLE